jgi:hypothetical protein
VDFILKLYERFEYFYCLNLNLQSKTDAYGWSYLMSGFSDKKVEFGLLLPVDLESHTKTVKDLKPGYLQPTLETIDTVKKLMQRNKIPRRVLARLISTGVLSII